MDITKHKNLPVTFCVNREFSKKDTRFLSVTIDVMHTGLNLNGSVFDKKIVEENLETIKNTAILGFIKYDENDEPEDFTKHEYKYVERDGKGKYIYAGASYGVIPESCHPRWVSKVDPDGVEREYLQVDALLWTKFDDSIEIFNRDGEKNQSMELEFTSIEGFEDENNIFHFTKFKFDGCCILSTTDNKIQPAMMGGNVVANFDTNSIFGEIKEKLEIYNTFISNPDHFLGNEGDINKSDFGKKEDINLNEKLELLKQYNLTIESFDFSIEDISVNDLKLKIEEFNKKKEDEAAKDFALVQQFTEELIEKLSEEKITSEWGEYARRSYIDHDNETSVVYFMDRTDYKIYGCEFTKTGDSATINFETTKRMKFVMTPFENGVDTDFSFENSVKDVFEVVKNKFESALTSLQSEFESYKENYKTIETDVEALREFQTKTLTEERKNAVDSVFTAFEEKLSASEEFKSLKKVENHSNMSVEDIEKECYAILGRQNFTFFKKSKEENKTPKLPVHAPADYSKLYGGAFAQHGKTPQSN